MSLETHSVECPYCGEVIEIDIEPMEESQSFIEDCTVCCRPIQYQVNTGEDGSEIAVSRSE